MVFKTSDNAQAALEANGTVFHDHHLRVDIAKSVKNEIDSKKSVFLGNVSFGKYFRASTSWPVTNISVKTVPLFLLIQLLRRKTCGKCLLSVEKLKVCALCETQSPLSLKE